MSPNVDRIAKGSYKLPETAIKASANVWQTLEAALWAFSQSDSFEQGLLLAVNLGGDTDTVKSTLCFE